MRGSPVPTVAANAVGSSATPRSTVNPRSSRKSAQAALERTSCNAISGLSWMNFESAIRSSAASSMARTAAACAAFRSMSWIVAVNRPSFVSNLVPEGGVTIPAHRGGPTQSVVSFRAPQDECNPVRAPRHLRSPLPSSPTTRFRSATWLGMTRAWSCTRNIRPCRWAEQAAGSSPAVPRSAISVSEC